MKEKKITKQKLIEYGIISKRHIVSLAVLFFSIGIYIYARNDSSFAELVSREPTAYVRLIYGKLTSLFPFSLAEVFFLSIPALLLILRSIFKKVIDFGSDAKYYNTLITVLCIVSFIASYLMVFFGVCYFRKPLNENIGLERNPVSKEELRDTALILSGEIEKLCPDIVFTKNGASHMPYSYAELNGKLNEAYSKYASKNDYIISMETRAKPVAVSELWIYTHISGVYTFFTGEANINTAYPDFVMPYTMAHEMSHQRGIAREDEANFVAFLVSLESDDSYIKYSAYVNMLDYVLDALYSADKDIYTDVYYKMPIELRYEYYAYSQFFKKYANSTASKVTTAVNDAYLHSQGQKEGTKSYGMVVDLTVAYYKSEA